MTELPSIKECDELVEKFHVLPNIREHLLMVRKVACKIGEEFIRSGIKVDVELIDRTARLHDLFKFVEFDGSTHTKYSTGNKEDWKVWDEVKKEFSGLDHEKVATKYFENKYPKLSVTLSKVGYLTLGKQKTWEEKIVYYSDMCVMHNKITDVKTRLMEGKSRFLKRKIRYHEPVDLSEEILRLEKQIFDNIKITPANLLELNEENRK